LRTWLFCLASTNSLTRAVAVVQENEWTAQQWFERGMAARCRRESTCVQ
jgi:hypothetical protein